jgi:hypothetical protein
MLTQACRFALLLAAALAALSPAVVVADGCATCEPSAAVAATCKPEIQYVEKTVMCPQWVTEMRRCVVTEYRREPRECTVTVCKRIPEVKAVQQTCCVMVREVRTRTEEYMACKPVYREETREYTVMVPTVETRQGTRTVCKWVPEKRKQIVCEDQGQWVEQPCNCGCCFDPCASACGRWCWVPKIVQKEVEVTCMKAVMVEEPCTYQVTVCKPVKKTCKVQVCEYQQVPATRQVRYTVCVPKQVTKTVYHTTWRCEQAQETRRYTVCVPYQVEKEVPVRVCKMVPKTIRVPVCPTCCCEVTCCKARHCCP